jgi:hypothetical protein
VVHKGKMKWEKKTSYKSGNEQRSKLSWPKNMEISKGLLKWVKNISIM